MARLRADNVGRKWRALLFAHEFTRHSDKRQLIQIQEAHGESIAQESVKAEYNLRVPQSIQAPEVRGHPALMFARILVQPKYTEDKKETERE